MRTDPATEQISRDKIVQRLLEKKQIIFYICLGFTADPVQAEELTQDVYLKAIARLNSLKDRSQPEAWFLRIARNVCLNYHRRNTLTKRIFSKSTSEPAHEHTPEVRMEVKENISALKKAVNILPERQKATFVLYEYGGLSYEEIAAALNIRLGTVMSRLSRARASVQKAMTVFHQEKNHE
jgi:RNA polymerase sigma-70 factor, ECF subfamily